MTDETVGWLSAALVAFFTIGLAPLPLASTPTYAYDTVAYCYDAPALLCSSDTVGLYVPGSPSGSGRRLG